MNGYASAFSCRYRPTCIVGLKETSQNFHCAEARGEGTEGHPAGSLMSSYTSCIEVHVRYYPSSNQGIGLLSLFTDNQGGGGPGSQNEWLARPRSQKAS